MTCHAFESSVDKISFYSNIETASAGELENPAKSNTGGITMCKNRIFVLILVIVLIGGIFSAGSVRADESTTNLAYDMIALMEDAETSFDAFINDEITTEEFIEDFRDYNGRAVFIYIESLQTGQSKEFIKLSAGLSLVMDVYLAGLEEGNVEKIKLADLMLEYALIPQLEKVDVGE